MIRVDHAMSENKTHFDLTPLKRYRFAAGVVLLVVAGGWLGWLLWQNIHNLSQAAAALSITAIAFAIIPAALIRLVNARIFYLFLTHESTSRIAGRLYLRHYFASQIVRYLPGRIWSIVYQSGAWAEHAPAPAVWTANLNYIASTSVHSIGIAAAVLLFHMGHSWAAVIVTIITIGGTFAILRAKYFSRLLSRLGLRGNSATRPFPAGMAVALMLLEWAVFFGFWRLLLPDHYSGHAVVIIAAAYIVAWLIGIASAIVPDGWFVREASFVFIVTAAGYAAPQMLVAGAAARAVFMLADIATVTLTYATCRTDP